MPDISMCADDECPSRAECYRHKASGTKPSSFWQAYSTFRREPYAKQCSAFWPAYPTWRAPVVQSEQDIVSTRADNQDTISPRAG